MLELEYKKICFATNDVNFSLPSVDSFSQKFKDEFAKDVPSGLPTIQIKDHQFDFIPNRPKDQIDFSSWRKCVVCNAIYNIMAKIRGRIFLKSREMMGSGNHTQGVGFVFEWRHVLAKPWFINNVKYVQDWQRGQSNKFSTSFEVIRSLGESWRGEINESVWKLPKSVDRIAQRLRVVAPSHGS